MQNINAHNENFFLSLDPCTCVLIKTRNWVEYNIFQTLIKAQYHIVYCKLSCRSIVAYTVTNAPTCVAYFFYFLLHRSRAFRYKYAYDKCNDAACIFIMLCKKHQFWAFLDMILTVILCQISRKIFISFRFTLTNFHFVSTFQIKRYKYVPQRLPAERCRCDT